MMGNGLLSLDVEAKTLLGKKNRLISASLISSIHGFTVSIKTPCADQGSNRKITSH
jgi:hypothetical protein